MDDGPEGLKYVACLLYSKTYSCLRLWNNWLFSDFVLCLFCFLKVGWRPLTWRSYQIRWVRVQ